MAPVIDHMSLHVSNPDDSRAFYVKALAPLGYRVVLDFGSVCALGVPDASGKAVPELWLIPNDHPSAVHLALAASTTERVDAFHAAALAAGGKDNGAPGERPHYHAGYYGAGYYAAFILDPDGHNIEAVCHHVPVDRPQD